MTKAFFKLSVARQATECIEAAIRDGHVHPEITTAYRLMHTEMGRVDHINKQAQTQVQT